MTEYIKRDAAVKIAEKYGTCNGSVLGRHSGVADVIAAMIDAMPAADVAPVVHGKWGENVVRGLGRPEKRWMVCSRCGGYNGTGIKFNYCPNCGARMDGGEDDEA